MNKCCAKGKNIGNYDGDKGPVKYCKECGRTETSGEIKS